MLTALTFSLTVSLDVSDAYMLPREEGFGNPGKFVT